MKNKWIQILLAVCISGAVGFVAGKGQKPEPEIAIEEKVVEKTVVDEEAIELAIKQARQEWNKLQKQRVVTRVVTKPSGEIIEESVTETETLEKSESSAESSQEKVSKTNETNDILKESTVKRTYTRANNWSLGVHLEKERSEWLTTLPNKELSYRPIIGRRVLWDVWVDVSYNIQNKEVGIGVRWEF